MGISLDEVILSASSSSIAISDGTDTLAINGDGSINATVSGTVTVSATNLDIRDLVFATDKVDVSGSSVTVSATDLDIRNLSFATDTVDVSGSTVNFTPASYTAMKASAATVTTSAAQVLASPLANRKELTIQNEGNQDVYIGHDATVTSSNGIKLSRSSSATYLIPAGVDVYMISSSGSQSVRFLELA